MNTAFLLLGGNLGNRVEYLDVAKGWIQQRCGAIVQSSSMYETAPWGRKDQPAFLNQAVQVNTTLTARELMKQLLEIEKLMGREPSEKYGPRVIDIDILLFNDEKWDDSSLKIPHPELQNRRFALVPLAEIGGTVEHPVLKKSISLLLAECPDQLEVMKYAG